MLVPLFVGARTCGVLILATLVLLSATAVTPALAQGNPFARPEVKATPEPEPEVVQIPTPAQPLPPSSVAGQGSILDYSSELNSLELVALRNGVAVLRSISMVYFLKDGEDFNLNGATYVVSISGNKFALSLPAEDKDEDEPTPIVAKGKKGSQAAAKAEKKEPLEVLVKYIGRALSTTPSSGGESDSSGVGVKG